MQIARPARLKPGITLDALPGPRPSDETTDVGPRLVRGRALIFWDPRTPGKKLDAIDTDQITPAADCVSESLETLDERSRELIRLKFTEDLSYKQISERTGLKTGHVGYLLHHALKSIAVELAKSGVLP